MAQPQSRQRPLPEHQRPHQRQQDKLQQRQEQEGEGGQLEGSRARVRNAMERLRNAAGAFKSVPKGRHSPTATTTSNERRAFPSSSPSPPSPSPVDAQQDEEEPPDSDTEDEEESDADSDVKSGTSGASNMRTGNTSGGRPPPASVPATSRSSIDVRGTRLRCASPSLSTHSLPFLPSVFPLSIPSFPSSFFPSRLSVFDFIDYFLTASPRKPRPPPVQRTCRPRLPPLLSVPSPCLLAPELQSIRHRVPPVPIVVSPLPATQWPN